MKNMENQNDTLLFDEIEKLRSDITQIGDTLEENLNALRETFQGIMDGIEKMNVKLNEDHLLFIKIFENLFGGEPDMEKFKIEDKKKNAHLYVV